MSSELEQAAVTGGGAAASLPGANAQPAPVRPVEAATEAAPAPGFVRGTWAITRKELNIYFTTPMAYVLLGLFIFVMGYFFAVDVQRYMAWTRNAEQMLQFNPNALGQLNFTDLIFAPLVYNAALIFAFILPFLTMRLVAEEKRQQSIQLLMTSPIGSTSIVLGKFLATCIVVLFAVGLTFAYPLLLDLVAASGGVEWQTALTAYLGLFLVGAAFVAIGMFISSLTDSQIVAGFVTLIVLLLVWIIGWAATAGNATGIAHDLAQFASAPNHLTNFVKGILNLGDLSYYLSLIVLGLFLTRSAIERMRW